MLLQALDKIRESRRAKGFVYLVAVMDWFSRRVLAWRLSIGMDTDFCVEALQEAMERFGQPEVFNADQGVQFTSAAFLDELERFGVRISMDGKGRYIFIERLWRSLIRGGVYQGVWLDCRGTSQHRRVAFFLQR
jgi:putative transposase